MDVTTFKPLYVTDSHKTNISPEMMAAILARYSRKGEGLEAILEILDKTPADKFEETVWSFLDYGHASIGGLTGTIPVGIDKVSMLAPYLTFFLQPKQDGQETSTRYVEFKPEGLAHPSSFGIPEQLHDEWYKVMLEGFVLNKELTTRLDIVGSANPELTRIPEEVPEKVKVRMMKNFGFDRARYTIPLAGLTNFGLVMTAREWAETIKYLSGFDIPEFNELAFKLREDISRVAPRLMKHSIARPKTIAFADNFINRGIEYLLDNGINTEQVPDKVVVQTFVPKKTFIPECLSLQDELKINFEGKKNRYDYAKGLAEKIRIVISWNNMSIAEARDINRQRPCKKDTLLAPVGSYMPEISVEVMKESNLFDRYQQFLSDRARLMNKVLRSNNPHGYIGCLLLGDQTPFEIHTDGAHFVYVAELRTGVGVHFRYDDHVRQAYSELNKQIPELTNHIQLGTGEFE
jgi:thymidylate synthase ThyX